jgi:hypothetical protein
VLKDNSQCKRLIAVFKKKLELDKNLENGDHPNSQAVCDKINRAFPVRR